MAKGNVKNDFFVVWMDANIAKMRDARDTKSLLGRMTRGRLSIYDDVDHCVSEILDKLTDQRILFVVSNQFGPKAVDLIHDFPQIHTIYIYCQQRSVAEDWSRPYEKVSQIFTDKQALLRQISTDFGVVYDSEDLSISIFHLEEKEHTLQQLTHESAKFMWYHSIINVLSSMANYCNAKEDMLIECRTCYQHDEVETKKIDEFARKYTSTNAFWWYTYDSFVYRLLNKALRTQNVEIIFKFRFFINDLQNQIKQCYQQYLLRSRKEQHLTVYRGQRLKINEVELLRANVGEIISMNSFLSATTSRTIAEIFADTSDQTKNESPLQSALFIIDVRNFDHETTPFAFIKSYSCCEDEEEVLFSIGAIFKVESVEKSANTWHIHLQLNRQQNQEHKDLANYMLRQIGSEPNPSTLGWFLYRMGDFNMAKRYVDLLLKQLPANDIERANAYNLLGLIRKDLRRFTESIRAYKKALSIYSRSSNASAYCGQIIATHCNLGLAYLAVGDDRSADEQQMEAKDKLAKSPWRAEPLLVATTVTLKGKIQTVHKEYARACENFQTALERKKMKLSNDHPSMASTFIDLGITYEHMGHLDQALDYFNKALTIREKSLSKDHLDMVECLEGLARIYDQRRQSELALKYKKSAKEIQQHDIRE